MGKLKILLYFWAVPPVLTLLFFVCRQIYYVWRWDSLLVPLEIFAQVMAFLAILALWPVWIGLFIYFLWRDGQRLPNGGYLSIEKRRTFWNKQ